MLEAPSLYDEFLRHLARRDYPVPADCVERDFSEPHRRREDLLPVFKAIYDAPKRDWEAYEMCEELVDVEESFQLWRFRHMKTVERIIGYKRGTGGSSGVGLPARRARPDVLPGAARRADRDRELTPGVSGMSTVG